jgi:hypothetical protein
VPKEEDVIIDDQHIEVPKEEDVIIDVDTDR